VIDYLTGRLSAVAPGKVVLEIGGVGFSIETPSAENSELQANIGQEVTFYTRVMVKEEEIYIYGFQAAEERKLFNLMLTVSGYGPRLALSLLAIFTVSELYIAVLEENIAQLCRAHGVGRKAAQRLVFELKEKLPKVMSAEEVAAGPVSLTGSSIADDITEALYALGYSGTEAAEAVHKVVGQNKNASREELLKLALKSMAGH